MDQSIFDNDKYTKDKIRAIDAKVEAQKIAFSPLTFQAVRALIDLNILQLINSTGDNGISIPEITEKTSISEYGIKVLVEMALGMNILKIKKEENNYFKTNISEKFVLGKIGWFLIEDDLTRVNFNFVNDICYKGAFDLKKSITSGKPEGLKVFGNNWTTVYEALSSLPEKEKKSWFEFDHFYSDIAFPEALPIVYNDKPKTLMDIGGNTAKWALASCKYDPDVHITIVDLPGQTAVAEKNIKAAGFTNRIDICSGNVLDKSTKLPENYDAVWMSQFLDCFSLKQVTKILTKIAESSNKNTKVYVLEPLWDQQHYEGSAYSLQATSLYFTCIANGNSKMYRFAELKSAIEKAGFELKCAHHNLGSNCYSLLIFSKK